MTETIAMCDHCHEKPAEFVDYRGPDVISKYKLCADCAALTDEEFFNIAPPSDQEPPSNQPNA